MLVLFAGLSLLACNAAPDPGLGMNVDPPDASVGADAARVDQANGNTFIPREPVEMPEEAAATLPAPVPGSRISFLWSRGDEAQVLRGLYDNQRKEPCAWITAADGVLRCLPTDRTLILDAWHADAECTRPVVLQVKRVCPSEPQKYIAAPRPTCPTGWAIHTRGERLATTTVYVKSATGSCTALPTVTSEREVYAIGPEIPATEFAAGKYAVGVATGGLAPLTIEGADGSRLWDSWRDVNGRYDCRGVPASDGKVRCLPFSSSDLGVYYTDSLCTEERSVVGAFKSSCTDAEPRFFTTRVATGGTCGEGTAVRRLGPRVPEGQRYARRSNQCSASAVPNDRFDFLSLPVDPVPTSTFQEASTTIAPGSGRLRQRTEGTAAGVAAPNGLWDTELEVSCGSGYAADGSLRCLPLRTTFDNLYTTSACVGRELVLLRETDCRTAYVGRAEAGTCPVRNRIHRVSAAPITGSVYHRDLQRGCIKVQPSTGYKAYLVGPEVDPEELAPIEWIGAN